VNRVEDALRRTARSLRRRFVPNALERRVAGLGLGPGDVAIDCGATVGVVTVALARTGAEVYAFEPNPDAFGELANRIGTRGNIHLYPQAVLDRDETDRLRERHRDEGLADKVQTNWI
jgi:16S rRNA A1518/A1519 N6-dimethyltransferase RsmA/KsgA/DIM1 with predicted DNA glycosylase/AP lyase activity